MAWMIWLGIAVGIVVSVKLPGLNLAFFSLVHGKGLRRSWSL